MRFLMSKSHESKENIKQHYNKILGFSAVITVKIKQIYDFAIKMINC